MVAGQQSRINGAAIGSVILALSALAAAGFHAYSIRADALGAFAFGVSLNLWIALECGLVLRHYDGRCLPLRRIMIASALNGAAVFVLLFVERLGMSFIGITFLVYAGACLSAGLTGEKSLAVAALALSVMVAFLTFPTLDNPLRQQPVYMLVHFPRLLLLLLPPALVLINCTEKEPSSHA